MVRNVGGAPGLVHGELERQIGSPHLTAVERRAVVQRGARGDALAQMHADVDDDTHGAQHLCAEVPQPMVGIVEPAELIAELLGVQRPSLAVTGDEAHRVAHG